jgi:hypothetical protein
VGKSWNIYIGFLMVKGIVVFGDETNKKNQGLGCCFMDVNSSQ